MQVGFWVFLHDVCQQANDEETYIHKMSIIDGKIVCDFTILHWILEYMSHSIHICNKNNNWILLKVRNENEGGILNIIHRVSDFELLDTCYQFGNPSKFINYNTYDKISNNFNENLKN
jgi:hypothetical protein